MSRDVGMRTKITGTACDVSSVGMGMGMEVLVSLGVAGRDWAGWAGRDWLADTMLQ